MKVLGWTLALGFSFFATVGAAQAQIYDCLINAGPSQVAITPRYIFDYDPAKNRVQVFDGLIKHFVGKPIDGKVADDTASRTTFSWSVQIVTGTGQQARILFHGIYIKADHSAIITASVGGGDYIGNWDARGSCVTKTK